LNASASGSFISLAAQAVAPARAAVLAPLHAGHSPAVVGDHDSALVLAMTLLAMNYHGIAA
jgi:hypothetical protein